MRYGYWAPVFGGWLRNLPDEDGPANWETMSRLVRRSEEIGYDLTLIAELNLNDIKGLKFRVPQSAILLACYKAWGANPVPISWAETFTALQQGLVDGQCYGYITFLACKFNEVQKYITYFFIALL